MTVIADYITKMEKVVEAARCICKKCNTKRKDWGWCESCPFSPVRAAIAELDEEATDVSESD